ncbi:hypothetical protein COB18_02845 [Candidatus Kaiserbacteria bacterium]|nr:MAG: hypothetical protein COB18_02845 [Candidatus Kaiserbacteria bacterium]
MVVNYLELLWRLVFRKPMDFELVGEKEAAGTEVGGLLVTRVYPEMSEAIYFELGTVTTYVLVNNLKGKVNAFCIIESSPISGGRRRSTVQPCFIEG